MTDSRRRRRLSLGGSSRAEGEPNDPEGYVDPNFEDHDEDADLDMDLNSIVREQARTDPAPVAPPSERLASVGSRASSYEREYRLKLLHRLLMRNLPLDKIAEELQVSVHTVMKDRRELYKRLRQQVGDTEFNSLMGDTLGFYAEVQGMALRAATSNKNPTNLKLAALRTAMTARNDMTRFLNVAGVFDALQFKPTEGSDASEVERLMEATYKLINSDKDIEDAADKEGITDMLDGDMGYDDDEDEDNLELRLY